MNWGSKVIDTVKRAGKKVSPETVAESLRNSAPNKTRQIFRDTPSDVIAKSLKTLSAREMKDQVHNAMSEVSFVAKAFDAADAETKTRLITKIIPKDSALILGCVSPRTRQQAFLNLRGFYKRAATVFNAADRITMGLLFVDVAAENLGKVLKYATRSAIREAVTAGVKKNARKVAKAFEHTDDRTKGALLIHVDPAAAGKVLPHITRKTFIAAFNHAARYKGYVRNIAERIDATDHAPTIARLFTNVNVDHASRVVNRVSKRTLRKAFSQTRRTRLRFAKVFDATNSETKGRIVRYVGPSELGPVLNRVSYESFARGIVEGLKYNGSRKRIAAVVDECNKRMQGALFSQVPMDSAAELLRYISPITVKNAATNAKTVPDRIANVLDAANKNARHLFVDSVDPDILGNVLDFVSPDTLESAIKLLNDSSFGKVLQHVDTLTSKKIGEILGSTKSSRNDELRKLKQKWEKVAVIEYEISFLTMLDIVYGPSTNLEKVKKIAKVTEENVFTTSNNIKSEGIDLKKPFKVGQFLVYHWRKVGDWNKGFKRGKWLKTHAGAFCYIAQNRRFTGSFTLRTFDHYNKTWFYLAVVEAKRTAKTVLVENREMATTFDFSTGASDSGYHQILTSDGKWALTFNDSSDRIQFELESQFHPHGNSLSSGVQNRRKSKWWLDEDYFLINEKTGTVTKKFLRIDNNGDVYGEQLQVDDPEDEPMIGPIVSMLKISPALSRDRILEFHGPNTKRKGIILGEPGNDIAKFWVHERV